MPNRCGELPIHTHRPSLADRDRGGSPDFFLRAATLSVRDCWSLVSPFFSHPPLHKLQKLQRARGAMSCRTAAQLDMVYMRLYTVLIWGVVVLIIRDSLERRNRTHTHTQAQPPASLPSSRSRRVGGPARTVCYTRSAWPKTSPSPTHPPRG